MIAIGAVGVLCAAAVVFGVGMASAKYHLADVGGWLTSSKKGELVHVNGLSGKVDGKVTLSGTAGHTMRVIQQGGVVLIVDETTGVVSRVDPAHLNVVQGVSYRGAAGMQVVSGSGAAYALDQMKGNVQRLDPMTLATAGDPVSLTGPLGAAAIDAKSTLWVPVPTNGQAASVLSGRPGQPVGVGRAGDDLALTIAGGAAVVTDFTTAESLVLGDGGIRVKVKLPSIVAQLGKGHVTAPPTSTEGQLVPLLAGKSLIVINAGSGSVSSVSLQLPEHKLMTPQVLGQRVYIPDQSSGSLLVYDSATNRMASQVPVSGRPGPLEAFVKDGLLWVNNPDSPKAVVVDGSGAHKPVQKYTGKVPGGPENPIPKGDDQGQDNNQDNNQPTSNAPAPPVPTSAPPVPRIPTHSPRPRSHKPSIKPPKTPPPPKTEAPKVTPPNKPTNLRAAAQPDGSIKVDFQPGGGGKATGYKIVLPAGLTATPARIPADGPDYTFTVRGGTCGTEYVFAVAATYQNGDHESEIESDQSDPTLSCTQPDAPSGITGTGTAQGARIGWQAPPNAKGVTYRLQVTGPKSYTKDGISGTSVTIPSIWKNGSYTIRVTASNGAGGKTGSATRALRGPVRTYGIHNGGNPTDVSYVWSQASSKSTLVEEIKNANTQKVKVDCQKIGTQYNHPNGKAAFSGKLYDHITHNGHVGYMIGYLPNTPHTPWQELAGPTIWECAG
ncbi:fibronectin type III domain-containing protein [Actinoallomurus spadix]|uniref:fibronectin type III domain-containing protein n=1 Tax=Actinoallomurus spadix TaxID=79912 RepID=UPI0020937E21|nr:fibronectin type III domain-containing protein [Actinoallomurus spadix]MCO5985817.1 fibronectin type III domain-containing protein [Actinoallomurus spadix]